jgi:putative PEP-CTERM system TPR-repeat lipoprotein
MSGLQRRYLWRSVVFAVALWAAAWAAASAKESSLVKEAEQYLANGDAKSALVTLKNAIRKSPEDPAIRMQAAKVYLELGDIFSAEREARAARDLKADEAEYLPILIDALLAQQKFKDLNDLIEPGDRNPVLESKVRTALGTATVRLGYDQKAEALLRDAIRLDASVAEPRVELARFLNRTRREEADRVIDEAIADNPQSAQLIQVKGEMLWSRGDAAGAVRLFGEALKIDPNYQLARLSRANVNVARGEFAAADEDLDPILQAAPKNFMANYLRGLEQVKKQQYVAADRIFDRISPYFKAFPQGYYLQGATKLGLGQFAPAEQILGKYLARVHDDSRAVVLMANAALAQHGAARAIDYLKPLVETAPPDPAVLTVLGNAYMADGKPELALKQFQKAATLDPDSLLIRTRVAVAELNTDQRRQGLAQLEEVFAGEAGAIIAGPTLVLAELRAGQVDKAAEAAASLIKREADNPLYQTLLGEVRFVQKDYAAAETAFRAAMARSPGFAAPAQDLAQIYLAAKRTDAAKRVYNDFLSQKPNDTTALLGLADIAIAEEKWSEATDLLNSARAAAAFDPTPGLKLMGLYESRRDWNSAKAVGAELFARFPRDVNVVAALGRTQLESGDTNAAISSYKVAYQLAPDSIPIRSVYVALLRQAKFFRDAFDVLQQAIRQEPQDASLKADLIRVDAEIDGLEGALSRARVFAASDPESSVYDLVSAELYEKAGRAGEAVALLETATAARPADDRLAVALSGLYARTGDFPKSEAVLRDRQKPDPKNPLIGLALAPLYVTTGQPEDAKKIYKDLLSQSPGDIRPLIGLADIAIAQMKWEEATGYIKQALAAAPTDPVPGLRLVNLSAARRDWKNAVATAAELAAKFPGNPDVLDANGRAQIGAGDTAGAVATYKRAYELAPDSPVALSHYLSVLRATKNVSEAGTVLHAAVDRDPWNASLKGDLIRVEAETDGLEAGLAAARDFAKNDPDNPLYDVVSAELHEKAGRPGDGIGLLEKMVAARPTDDYLAIALSGLYSRAGVPAKGEALLKSRLKADPKDFVARSALASFYLEQKRYAAAIAEYSRVIDDHPRDPSALNNLAWLYQQQGDLTSARELAERAFNLTPGSAQIVDTLGWILLNQGDPGKALAYLSAANTAAPRNPNIQYHLAVVLQQLGRSAAARATLETLLDSGVTFADKADAEKLLQDLKRG